jgi:predicted ATP-binding protein involved in virulence
MKKAFDIPLSLDRVEISNFRLFGELKAVLHPQLTVFIAPNSGGKTALLDAIAMMLKSVAHPTVSYWQSGDSRKVSVNAAKALSHKTPTPNSIKLKLSAQSSYLNLLIEEKHNNGSLSILGTPIASNNKPLFPSNGVKNTVSPYMQQLSESIQQSITNGSDKNLPLMAYFSANRRVQNSTAINTAQEFELSREQARLTLLPCLDLHDFDRWLRERAITGLETRLAMEENNETGKPTPDAQLTAVSTVLATMLKQEVCVKTVKYFASTKSIQAVKENGERFDIDQLSHGAKSVLMIAAKLAMHCCALNPHLRDQAPALTPGIILIDEIDLHLHPRWQQHVIADLQQCFPKMQFIISTHSPAILSTVKKENIRVIDIDYATGKSSATEPLTRSYGASIADTLESIMGVDARPDNALVRMINDYLNWAENGDLTEDRSEQRAELEAAKVEDDLLQADLIIQRRKILAGKK